jgi:hypothetical protein
MPAKIIAIDIVFFILSVFQQDSFPVLAYGDQNQKEKFLPFFFILVHT